MPKEIKKLLIAASGTGGHIIPALAIAEEMNKSWEISWLGIKKRCEDTIVPEKYKLFNLNIDSPNKKNLLLILQYVKIIFSTIRVINILKERKINLVFTTGGYISAPAILAAKIINIPVVIHESNLIPGTVTKYFGFLCDSVLIGFKETEFYLHKCNIKLTGTPLRRDFYKKTKLPNWVPSGNGPLLLVMGGSQGAVALNEIIYESLDFFVNKNIRLVHIVGNNNLNKKLKKYKNYVQICYTNDIPGLMSNCDLVVSRSGAGTINELIETKKPSILIPYPNSKNGHQKKNASILASRGGSILLDQNFLSVDIFQSILKRVFKLSANKKNYKILDLMKENMNNIQRIDSKKEIKVFLNNLIK